MTKYISIPKVVDVEEIVNVEHPRSGGTYVTTDAGRSMEIVSSQPVNVGDVLNVTDPDDIYHMPRKIIEGDDRKYDPYTEDE